METYYDKMYNVTTGVTDLIHEGLKLSPSKIFSNQWGKSSDRQPSRSEWLTFWGFNLLNSPQEELQEKLSG